MSALNATLSAITGLRDPLHEERDLMRELAFAEGDLKILVTDLAQALRLTTAAQAEEFAIGFGVYANAFRELETLALKRARRLGSAPLPFQEHP